MKIDRFVGGILESNCYILYHAKAPKGIEKEAFIIDPGYNPKKIIAFAKDNKLNVKGILLTHHHYDHSGGAARISKELGCPIYIHRLDGDMLKRDADILLEDGAVLHLNEEEKLHVIHTPGHTRGSVCFMDVKGKVCFTGDTIFDVDLGRTDLEDGSEKDLIQSMKAVVNTWGNDVRIYPGHGNTTTMKSVRNINKEFLEAIGGASNGY